MDVFWVDLASVTIELVLSEVLANDVEAMEMAHKPLLLIAKGGVARRK